LSGITTEIKPVESEHSELQQANAKKKDEEIPQADKDKLEDLQKKIDELKDKKNDLLRKFGKRE